MIIDNQVGLGPGSCRSHGRGIYTQNQGGTKTITNCILTGGFGWSMHAYGSKQAYLNHYRIGENIAYQSNHEFLIGGGGPIQVVKNYLYGTGLRLGYDAPENEDCVVQGNLIVNGDLAINRCKKVVDQDNLIVAVGNKRPGKVARATCLGRQWPAGNAGGKTTEVPVAGESAGMCCGNVTAGGNGRAAFSHHRQASIQSKAGSSLVPFRARPPR